MQGNWVVEICWQMPRIEIAGNIFLRKPMLTPGCRANDDDDDDDDITKKSSKIVFIEKIQSVLPMV
jgi:hypothetical protein